MQSISLPGQYPQAAGISSYDYHSQAYQSDFGFRTGNTFGNQTGPGQFSGEESLCVFATAATDNRKDARPPHFIKRTTSIKYIEIRLSQSAKRIGGLIDLGEIIVALSSLSIDAPY